MSAEAIRWAIEQTPARPVDKLVLIMLAKCHNVKSGCCFPSQSWLTQSTLLDRETLRESLRRLEREGWIKDTGRREGHTGKVKVYRLLLDDRRHPQPDLFNADDDLFNVRENPPVKSAGKSAHSIGGVMCGDSATNVRENPLHNVREMPLQKHVRETCKETSGKQSRARARENPYPKPAEIEPQIWKDFLEVRKRKGRPNTTTAHKRLIDDLTRISDQTGANWNDLVRQSAEMGWIGIFPLKPQSINGGNHDQSANGDYSQVRNQILRDHLERGGSVS